MIEQIKWGCGDLLYGPLDDTRPKYWRLVARATSPLQPQESTIFVLGLDEKSTPHCSRLPIAYREINARKKLTRVAECVRHAFMDLPDKQISKSRRTRRDRLFAKIEDLVCKENIGRLRSPSTRPLC